MILPLHLLVLTFTAIFILLSDWEGLLWIRGKKPMLDRTKILKYHRNVYIGLGLMITTGLIMFWPMRNFLLTDTAFLWKILFVVILLINSFIIGRHIAIATTRTYMSLTFKEKIPLFASGAISTLAWLSAATLALFLF